MTRSRGLAALQLLVAASVAVPGAVRAQDSSALFLIPYSGQLEHNGSPVATPVDLRVGLFAVSDAGALDCLLGDLGACGLWADEFTAVPVHGGHFTLLLGSGRAIPDSALANPNVYVAVAVRNGGGWLRLAGAQRLASTPYAVRARAGTDLRVDHDLGVSHDVLVGGSVGIGTIAPVEKLHVEGGELRVRAGHNDGAQDVASFARNDLTQSVGIRASGIAATGSNANQDLNLSARGTGSVTAQAAVDDGTGTLGYYPVSLRRYKVVANNTSTSRVRSYTQVDQAVLESYCADEDGCRITLRMRNWNGSGGALTSRSATSFSLHFHYGDLVNGQRYWRREAVAASPNAAIVLGNESGVDNNGSYDHVLRNHDCYFTDSLYTPPNSEVDNRLGMGLLNYDASGYNCTCELIIDD